MPIDEGDASEAQDQAAYRAPSVMGPSVVLRRARAFRALFHS